MQLDGDARRILLIDDNQAIHEDYRKILNPAVDRETTVDELAAALFGEPAPAAPAPEFELDSAMQGEQGHAMLRAALRAGKPYAVAFVDMRMPPGWDGVETIAHLWEDAPDLEVVICTAYSDTSWEDIARRLGPSDRLLILKKPFDHMEVQQLAWALTEKWRLRRETGEKVREVDALLAQLGERLRPAAPPEPDAQDASNPGDLLTRARSVLSVLATITRPASPGGQA